MTIHNHNKLWLGLAGFLTIILVSLLVVIIGLASTSDTKTENVKQDQRIERVGNLILEAKGLGNTKGLLNVSKTVRNLSPGSIHLKTTDTALLPVTVEIPNQLLKQKRSLNQDWDTSHAGIPENLEDLISDQRILAPKQFDIFTETDMELRSVLSFAKSLRCQSVEEVEQVTYQHGLSALFVSFEQPELDTTIFLARFSSAEVSKSVLIKFGPQGITIFDQNGGVTIDASSGAVTVHTSDENLPETCGYWTCVGNCMSEIPGIINTICAAFLGACLLEPSKLTCIGMVVCYGAVGGYCLVDCGLDVCSHCDCQTSINIKGRVLHDNGIPWDNLEVCLLDCDWNRLEDCSNANSEGYFSINKTTSVTSVRVGFFRGCDPVYGTDCFTPQSGTNDIGTVQLPDCGASLCFIANESNVYSFALPCNQDTVASACVTDGSGECCVTLEPGSYWFAFYRDCDCYLYYTDCYDIPAGQWQLGVTLPPCETQICVEGVVRYEGGAAWPGVVVYATDCNYYVITSSTTNASGQYSMCFPDEDFRLVFDRGCCSGELYGTDCLSLVPCTYSVSDVYLPDCVTDPPAAPSDCVASDNLCDKVHFCWQDNSNTEDGFRLYRNGTPIDSVGANVTCFDDHSGVAGTSYSYCVKAYNGCGDSDQCCNNGKKETVPATPSNCVASDNLSDKVHFCWQENSNNEDGFKIYRSGDSIGTVGPNVTCYDDFEGAVGQSYDYCVKAYNNCGVSTGQCCDPGIRPGEEPNPPFPCNASDNLCDKVSFCWQDNSDNEDGFKIYRNGTPIDSVGANVTCYDDYGATPGITYNYCVRAYNTNGESDPCCDDGTRLALPATPTNVTAECIDQYIHICWDNVAGESGYYIYRNSLLYDSVGVNISCYNDNNPGSGLRCYQISAYNICGQSSQSTQACDSCPSPPETDSIYLVYGWNMVSLPSVPSYNPIPKDSIFDWMPIYGYNCGTYSYYIPQYVKEGKGYWVARTVPSDTIITYFGTCVTCYTETLCLGWNMIGATCEPVPFANVVQNPQGCIIQNTLYWWNPSSNNYILEETLKPSRGYWVAAISPCTLTVCNPQAAPPLAKIETEAELEQPLWMASITITSDDDKENAVIREFGTSAYATQGFDNNLDLILPPPPVEEMALDAYFQNDGIFSRFGRDIKSTQSEQIWNLIVKSKTGISLNWNISQIPEDVEIRLYYEDQTINLKRQSYIHASEKGAYNFSINVVPKPASEKEQVTDELASKFELFQCYPNPFNLETVIRYHIAEGNRVTLNIYNISGQLVKTLVNDWKKAGYYEVVWDGNTDSGQEVSSGIYFYKLETNSLKEVRKVLLLK